MTILFAGGGTLGPVTPLLAVARKIKALRPDTNIVWAGTPNGPERALVEAEGFAFHAIPIAKAPRFFSVDWFRLPLDAFAAWRASLRLIRNVKPDAVLSAGGFTAVPVSYAAARRTIPCIAHQLDVTPGWSNRLVARVATLMTTSFAYHPSPFGTTPTEKIATPCRFAGAQLPSAAARGAFGLQPDRPTVLVMGGGTGAQALNDMVDRVRDTWTQDWNVLHLTGKGKGDLATRNSQLASPDASRYVVHPFLSDKMLAAYEAADVVVCRAGMGTLSELAALKKASVLVPIPGSHQEANAREFVRGRGAYSADRRPQAADKEVTRLVQSLMEDAGARGEMGEHAHALLPTDDGSALAKRVLTIVEKH